MHDRTKSLNLSPAQAPSRRIGGQALVSLLLSGALLTTACGKKDAEKKADPAPATPATAAVPAGEATTPTTAAVAAPTPLPETGFAYETFYAARLLQRCALKYGVAEKKAERMAMDLTDGKKPPVNLDAALQRAETKPKVAPEPPDTHEVEIAREKWRDAVRLGEAHTETAAKLAAESETCLFAPEVGMIEGKTIDSYVKIFAGVTCLQKKLTTAEGKVDETAHAQAATQIFADNGMSAGDFSRYGVIFSRFPIVVQKQYAARQAQCPETGAAAAPSPQVKVDALYNGGLEGGRIGSVRMEVRAGKVTAAIQWQGVPPPALDGRPQPPPIIPVTGTLGPKGLALSGELQGETLKLTGKLAGEILSGTWVSGRPESKTTGTFKAELLRTHAAPAEAAPK